MDPKIADYIARNHGRYTREAIRQQLIEAGHDPADIDRTWAVLDTPDPDEAAVAGEGFWPRFFLYLIGLNVAILVILGLLGGMFQNLDRGGGLIAAILAVALGVGALLAWGVVAAVGPAKLGRTTALVLGGVIPIVFALLIGGSCYALVGGAVGPPPLPAIDGEMQVEIDGPFALQASGPATCQPIGDSGFSVYANDMGQVDGAPLYVGLDAHGEGQGQVTSLTIQALGETETELREWFSSPDTSFTTDIAPDGLTGMVSFTGLDEASREGPGAGAPDSALSGTIRWSCETP